MAASSSYRRASAIRLRQKGQLELHLFVCRVGRIARRSVGSGSGCLAERRKDGHPLMCADRLGGVPPTAPLRFGSSASTGVGLTAHCVAGLESVRSHCTWRRVSARTLGVLVFERIRKDSVILARVRRPRWRLVASATGARSRSASGISGTTRALCSTSHTHTTDHDCRSAGRC